MSIENILLNKSVNGRFPAQVVMAHNCTRCGNRKRYGEVTVVIGE